jgi:hypothetical protein
MLFGSSVEWLQACEASMSLAEGRPGSMKDIYNRNSRVSPYSVPQRRELFIPLKLV